MQALHGPGPGASAGAETFQTGRVSVATTSPLGPMRPSGERRTRCYAGRCSVSTIMNAADCNEPVLPAAESREDSRQMKARRGGDDAATAKLRARAFERALCRASPLLLCPNGAVPERVRIISDYEQTRCQVLRAAWQALLDERAHETLFYQTPGYFDHLANTRDRRNISLAVLEDSRQAVVGVVPLILDEAALDMRISALRLTKFSFSSIRIPPGSPLVPSAHELLDLLFEDLAQMFPDRSIQISAVPTSSPLWTFVCNSPKIRETFMVYTPNGPRLCQTTAVPETVPGYLSGFRHKRRYNLKRQVRRLNQYSRGRLALRRIERGGDVASFRQAMVRLGIAANSEHDNSTLTSSEMLDLAERGMLLSYVLTAGEEPYALALGTRFKDTLLLHRFAHDASLDHLSPGTVLHVSMMEDLISNRLVKRIDYGFGEPKYKMNNALDERVNVMLIRRTVANRSSVLIHSAFQRGMDIVKRVEARREHRSALKDGSS